MDACFNINLVTDLSVESNVSLCLPHLIDERHFDVGIVLDAMNAVLSMCLLPVTLWSRVRPSIFGWVCVVLLICNLSPMLYKYIFERISSKVSLG